MTADAGTLTRMPPPPSRLEGISLFLDMDGVLAPLAPRPEDVVPVARRTAVLRRLSERLEGRLAIVSGRTIVEIDRISGDALTAASGVHGLERRRTDGSIERGAAAALADLKPKLEVVGGRDDLEVNESDVEQMRQLKVGTWIHIAGEDGKHHPVKLSWVSPISSRLMFTNRRGVRVLVASVEELAAMKQSGNLLVREQEQVFDQVLHRVMGKLKTEAN